MTLHRLDPNATQDCPCRTESNERRAPHPGCGLCHGNGRIPAAPDVEIVNGWDDQHQHLASEQPEETEYGWRIIKGPDDGWCACGCTARRFHYLARGSTPEEALEAARAAVGIAA